MLFSKCFFLESLQRVLEGFPRLFNERISAEGGEEGRSDRDGGGFIGSYGWLYSAKELSDFMNISLTDVWEINIYEALNYTQYLNDKAMYDRLKLKNARA